jgi:hypothetical protein
MRKEELEPRRFRYTSGHATLETWVPGEVRSPILIVTVRGHAKEEVVSPILDAIHDARRRGRMTVFDDWEGVTGYDSAARVRLTEWTAQNGDAFHATHILIASKLLAMGLSLATRAAGLSVHVYQSRMEFERVLRGHFPAYRPRRSA